MNNHLKSLKLKSFEEIEKDGWLIKMSTMNDHYILILLRSKFTNQTIVRYFDDQEIAKLFVDSVTELSPHDEQDI